MCMNRSKFYTYVQLIDDEEQKTIFCCNTKKILSKQLTGVGIETFAKAIVDRLKEFNIVKLFFDRNGLKYAGNIKLLIEKCRELGVKF